MRRKSEPKLPSPLGLKIEEAVEREPRYERHRANVQYLCTFRTTGGTVFAFERVGKIAINIWLPPTRAVISAVEAEGIVAPDIKVPWPDSHNPSRYGRLNSLKAIPELRDEPLLSVPVTSARQALAILAALP